MDSQSINKVVNQVTQNFYAAEINNCTVDVIIISIVAQVP